MRYSDKLIEKLFPASFVWQSEIKIGGIDMRIGSINMMNQLYGTGAAKKPGNVSTSGYTSFQDQVAFSTTGKDLQVAKNALAGVPDVREAKIADIKSRIDNGTYDVSVDDFASKLISAYQSQVF